MPEPLFDGQHSGEELKKVYHRHPVIFIIEALVIGLLLIIGSIGLVLLIQSQAESSTKQIGVALLSFYLFFMWFLFLAFFINYYYDVTILTNERLVDISQKGLFAREISEITLDHVQDVSAKQNGILQTVLDYGAVIVETAGEGTGPTGRSRGSDQIFALENLPHPNAVARLIIDLHAQVHEIEGEPIQ